MSAAPQKSTSVGVASGKKAVTAAKEKQKQIQVDDDEEEEEEEGEPLDINPVRT